MGRSLTGGLLTTTKMAMVPVTEEKFVIVCRSPSYHPGDIRVLRVVRLPHDHAIRGLRNCILFSTKGKRPEPDKMGGGDLDGDKYLVVWHPTLLKYANELRNVEPAEYDDDNPTKAAGKSLVGQYDWIHYAAMADNALLGEVEHTFYRIAKKHGVKSAQIKELNALFSSLVDRHPTSLNAFVKLKNSVIGDMTMGACVWEAMTALQTESSTNFQRESPPNYLASYRKFRDSAAWQVLSMKISEYRHHFNECMHWSKVAETRFAIDQLGKCTLDLVRRADIGDAENENAEIREINDRESDVLSEFETLAYELFRVPIAGITEDARREKTIRTEQLSRKQAICSSHEEEMSLLSSEKDHLDKECEIANLQHKTRFEACRRRKILLEAKISEGAKWQLANLKARLDERSMAFASEEAALKEDLKTIENVLGGTWNRYIGGVFSTTGFRQATEQKATIRRRLETWAKEIAGLQKNLSLKQQELESELAVIRLLAESEERREMHALQGKNRELKIAKERVELNIADCKNRFSDRMNGIEKSRLHARVVTKESEASALYTDLECQDQDDCHIQSKLQAVIKEVKKCQLVMQVMFCPKVLTAAEDAIQELDDREEGLKLGRERILRQVAKTRHDWRAVLATEILSAQLRHDRWNTLLANLRRVYALEENRLLGLPSGGKRNDPMPVYCKRGELQRHLRSSQALIITAGTGCGKSTQAPQYIADDFSMYRGDSEPTHTPVRICCTQPRRVAAQNLARTVAKEYNTTLGHLVGFKVGSKGRAIADCVKISESTIIEFVTEGERLEG
jgi:RNA dependent RNA polymerase